MSKQDFLPPEAIPGLIDLMGVFKKALRGQIQSFKKTGNVTAFQQVLAKLRADLIHYNATFDNWHQNAETYLEYQLLDELAKELGETQDLLCKANKIINTKF